MSETVRAVGIDLQDSEEGRALVDAIVADNPQVSIRRLPGLLKLTGAGQIVINRHTVERALGRDWETGEFQLAIVSCVGSLSEWDDDQIIVRWEH